MTIITTLYRPPTHHALHALHLLFSLTFPPLPKVTHHHSAVAVPANNGERSQNSFDQAAELPDQPLSLLSPLSFVSHARLNHGVL